MNQEVTSDQSDSSAIAELTSKTLAKYNWLQWFLYFLAVSLIIITGYLCILTPYGQVGSYILAVIYALSAISISFLTYDLVHVGYDLRHIDQDLIDNIQQEDKNLVIEKRLEDRFTADNKALKQQITKLKKTGIELNQSVEKLKIQLVTEKANNKRLETLQAKTEANNQAISKQNEYLSETTQEEQAGLEKLEKIYENTKNSKQNSEIKLYVQQYKRDQVKPDGKEIMGKLETILELSTLL
ncbi:hypothetical protein N9Y17_00330 [Gammaproteobacteria bacterium]|nr:hypothetical protein [Gammaproteobacteria bacterium]